jgi:hypothetical protein
MRYKNSLKSGLRKACIHNFENLIIDKKLVILGFHTIFKLFLMNFGNCSLLVFIFLSLFFSGISNGANVIKFNGYICTGDTLTIDGLKERANKAVEESAKLRPNATALQTDFLNYKLKAKGNKGGASDEANDGYQMASEAVKDCDEIDKIGKKVATANPQKAKVGDLLKLVTTAEKKVHNIKYLIHQTEDRRKEVQFELKGK